MRAFWRENAWEGGGVDRNVPQFPGSIGLRLQIYFYKGNGDELADQVHFEKRLDGK